MPNEPGRRPFVVPQDFLRNAPEVLAMGAPADVGLGLWTYMCERIGVADLGESDLLDFGCGSRFSDMLMNRSVPLRSYVGIDVDRSMIQWLAANAIDPRLSFHHIDARNPAYNCAGMPMGPDTPLPVGDRHFDIACMFSVITHQLPEDARAIFHILRRYIRARGWLFFSANLQEHLDGYGEVFPETPTAFSAYSPALLRSLLESAGWSIVSVVGKNPGGLPIQDSILCRPAG